MIHQPVHKVTIVAYDDQATRKFTQEIFQNPQCWQIKIICRFIQHEKVWISEKKLITEKLNNSNTSFEELQKLSVRIGEVTQILDEKEMRWLELSEFI